MLLKRKIFMLALLVTHLIIIQHVQESDAGKKKMLLKLLKHKGKLKTIALLLALAKKKMKPKFGILPIPIPMPFEFKIGEIDDYPKYPSYGAGGGYDYSNSYEEDGGNYGGGEMSYNDGGNSYGNMISSVTDNGYFGPGDYNDGSGSYGMPHGMGHGSTFDDESYDMSDYGGSSSYNGNSGGSNYGSNGADYSGGSSYNDNRDSGDAGNYNGGGQSYGAGGRGGGMAYNSGDQGYGDYRGGEEAYNGGGRDGEGGGGRGSGDYQNGYNSGGRDSAYSGMASSDESNYDGGGADYGALSGTDGNYQNGYNGRYNRDSDASSSGEGGQGYGDFRGNGGRGSGNYGSGSYNDNRYGGSSRYNGRDGSDSGEGQPYEANGAGEEMGYNGGGGIASSVESGENYSAERGQISGTYGDSSNSRFSKIGPKAIYFTIGASDFSNSGGSSNYGAAISENVKTKLDNVESNSNSIGNSYDKESSSGYKVGTKSNPFSRVYTTNEVNIKDSPEPLSKYTINNSIKTEDSSQFVTQKKENMYETGSDYKSSASSTPQEFRIAIIAADSSDKNTAESKIQPIIRPIIRDDNTIQLSLITPR